MAEAVPVPAQDRATQYAVAQSVTEISLGSLVHALKIPFGGHVLSLNQALILTFAVRSDSRRRDGARLSCQVSNIAALLKSLSPAGQKLSPMVAIAMQGLLYSLGITLVGVNLVGAILASALLSIWGFVHPLLTAYVIFGSSLFEAIQKLWTELAHGLGIDPDWGLRLLAFAVSLKLAAAAAVAVLGWFASEELENRYLEYLRRRKRPVTSAPLPLSPARGALRDLRSPLFVASFLLSVAFFLLAKDASAAQAALYGARIVASGYLLFWLVRAFPVGRLPWARKAAAELNLSTNDRGPEAAPPRR